MRATFGEGFKNDLWSSDRNELVKKNFGGLNADLSEVQREQHAWVYIFMTIGGLLMLDKSQNLVHLRWFLKLVDFREAGELNWGSAVLATLYQEMCRVTKP